MLRLLHRLNMYHIIFEQYSVKQFLYKRIRFPFLSLHMTTIQEQSNLQSELLPESIPMLHFLH